MVKRLFGLMTTIVGVMLAMILLGCPMDDDLNLDGTWVGDDGYVYVFSGSNFTLMVDTPTGRVNSQRGTFSINSARTEFTQRATHNWVSGSWVEMTFIDGVWSFEMLSDDSFKISGYGQTGTFGPFWSGVYTRQ